jgi:hypothetical protein
VPWAPGYLQTTRWRPLLVFLLLPDATSVRSADWWQSKGKSLSSIATSAATKTNRTTLPWLLYLPSPRSTSELYCFYLLCTVSPPSHCIHFFLLYHFLPTFANFTFIPHRYFVSTPC